MSGTLGWEMAMQAAKGDRLVVRSHHVGERDRAGLILAVEGDEGGPPYLVQWDHDGHQSLFFPGSDALVEHHPAAR